MRPTRLLLLVAFLLSGCASTQEVSDLERVYWERIEASRQNYVQADVDFMTGMIAHHKQALVMSAWAEPNGASPDIQVLTARIINAQKDEIATMEKWLRDRGEDVPGSDMQSGMQSGMQSDMQSDMQSGDHHDHHTMPGMLSQAQLDELEAAQGEDFDRLFLEYMIQHHQGAVTMVETLFATDGAGQDEGSFRLATDINVDQITEIERMQRMLRAMTE